MRSASSFAWAILIAICFFLFIGLVAFTSTESSVEQQIERHMDMCDRIRDEELRVNCYEGVPSEHELING